MNTQNSKKEIEIGLLNEEDVAEINTFHNAFYNDNRNKEKFYWEFFEAPAGKAIYVVAKDKETKQIVGTQCAIPIELITGKRGKMLTAKSEDTLVHPGYRGLQIFEKMYDLLFKECEKNGIKYIWGFTSAVKPFRKLGFEIPYDHSQSLIVLNILPSFHYLSKLNPKNNLISLTKLMALCILSKAKSIKTTFNYSESSINDFDIIVEDKSKLDFDNEIRFNGLKDGFSILKDRSYMDWRVKNNPYHENVVNVKFTKDSEVVANILFNYHKEGVWYLIDDSYSDNIDGKLKVDFLKKARIILKKHKLHDVVLIRAWDFLHNNYNINEITIREKAGFYHINRGISFVWKSLDKDESLDVKNFILSRVASQGVV